MLDTEPDYFKVLGVTRNASRKEIDRARRTIVAANHPDRHPGDQAAEERTKQANEAHDILSDPEEREKHEADLKRREELHRAAKRREEKERKAKERAPGTRAGEAAAEELDASQSQHPPRRGYRGEASAPRAYSGPETEVGKTAAPWQHPTSAHEPTSARKPGRVVFAVAALAVIAVAALLISHEIRSSSSLSDRYPAAFNPCVEAYGAAPVELICRHNDVTIAIVPYSDGDSGALSYVWDSPNEYELNSRSCPRQMKSIHAFFIAGRNDGQRAGELMCYFNQQGNVVLAWSDFAAETFTNATFAKHINRWQAYMWWRNNAFEDGVRPSAIPVEVS